MAECAGWALVITGILLAIAAGRETATLFASSNSWAETQATVVRTRVSPWKPVQLVSFGKPQGEFEVTQELVYIRKGQRYQETVVLGVHRTQTDAQRVAESAVKPGRTRQIWVDAANPQHIRLDPKSPRRTGWTRGLLAMLGLGSAPERAGGSA